MAKYGRVSTQNNTIDTSVMMTESKELNRTELKKSETEQCSHRMYVIVSKHSTSVIDITSESKELNS